MLYEIPLSLLHFFLYLCVIHNFDLSLPPFSFPFFSYQLHCYLFHFFSRIQSFLVDNLFSPEKLSVSEERKLRGGNATGCDSGNGSGVWRDIGEFLNHQSSGNSVNFISGIAYDDNNDYGKIIDDNESNFISKGEEVNKGDDNGDNKVKSGERKEGNDSNTTENNINNNNNNNNNNSNKNNSNNNTTRKRTLEPADSSINNTETVQTVSIVKIVAHL